MEFTGIIRNAIAIAIGVLVGAGIVYFFLPRKAEHLDEAGDKKRKIIEFVTARGIISREEVERYLAVSPDVAGLYLKELIDRDAIQTTNKPGSADSFYEIAAKKK